MFGALLQMLGGLPRLAVTFLSKALSKRPWVDDARREFASSHVTDGQASTLIYPLLDQVQKLACPWSTPSVLLLSVFEGVSHQHFCQSGAAMSVFVCSGCSCM